MEEKRLIRSTKLHDISCRERSEIVRLYAERIDLLCEFIDQAREELSSAPESAAADKVRPADDMSYLAGAATKMLGRHLIEQYYNTGDSDLFDRALRVDEEVALDGTTVLDLEFHEMMLREGSAPPAVTVFYHGLFFTIGNEGAREDSTGRYRLLVRDDATVGSINRKLDRARRMLALDELTIGKKDYEGLWLRSHFYKQQYSF